MRGEELPAASIGAMPVEGIATVYVLSAEGVRGPVSPCDYSRVPRRVVPLARPLGLQCNREDMAG